MACSTPNMMGFTGFHYAFRGARSQEMHVYDRQAMSADDFLYNFDVPCGKCELCLVARRYERALRIMLEAEFWPAKTYFITLTFDDAHLGSGKLDHDEWSQFVKNFRQEFCQAKYCDISVPRHYKRFGKVRSTTFKEIKQVMSGEYGDSFGRKHFHGILFNHQFDDVEVVLCDDGLPATSSKGNVIRTSQSLRDVWKKGNVQVEEVTWDLALYVGAYLNEPCDVGKNYGRMGHFIGLSWLKRYWRDVLSVGKIMLRDRDFPVPRYFSKWLEVNKPEEFFEFKRKRLLTAYARRLDSIGKGDGPLRRARAKGRIFAHVHSKKEKDNVVRKRQGL